jgi:hypothetical protein
VTTRQAQNVLYIIACGGRPAGDLPGFVRYARDHGWDVCVIATPSGMKFLDPDALAAATGHPVRSDYKRPDEPDVLPPPDAFVVAPATFNTVNKLAAGISDTLALGLLNEAVGTGLPIIAAPFPNQMLARHPFRIKESPATPCFPGPRSGRNSSNCRSASRAERGQWTCRMRRPACGPSSEFCGRRCARWG